MFSPVLQSQLLNKRQLIIYTEHHLSSCYLQWSLSQVNDKLTTLFTCSGSLFWVLCWSKDFLFCFGSEKQGVACSGFSTCFNAGSTVLCPGPLEGASVCGQSSARLWAGQAACPSARLKLGNPQRSEIGITIANHWGGGCVSLLLQSISYHFLIFAQSRRTSSSFWIWTQSLTCSILLWGPL